jgi:sodium-dependent dicarboxylate transporter 2/3/5
LAQFADLPLWALIGLICLSVTFLTEITSNTATTTILMPILASACVEHQIDPNNLMLPAALSASCAFMLPVATAPNAIVFGTGRVTMGDMVRCGFAINLAGVLLLTAWLLV